MVNHRRKCELFRFVNTAPSARYQVAASKVTSKRSNSTSETLLVKRLDSKRLRFPSDTPVALSSLHLLDLKLENIALS